MGSEKGHRRNLDQRLHNSGIEASTEPLVAWHQLRQIEGGRATVIDLSRLVSGPRGLQPHELPLEERHLRGHAPEEFTPFMLGRHLGHSSGAVANACHRLVANGTLLETSQKLRRFRFAG